VTGSAAISVADGFFLGTEDGGLLRMETGGEAAAFATETQIRVTDALLYEGAILYTTAEGSRGKIPADYNAILNGEAVTLPSRSGSGPSATGFPVSGLNGKLLYLEAQGPVVRAAENGIPGRELFSLFLPLAIDTDFADDENIVVAGMLATGGSLLRLINIATSETVPLDLPENIVLKVYRGQSGSLYAAVGDETDGKIRILKLDMRNPRQSRRLVEIGVEDDVFDMAEAGNALVTNMGSASADFYDAARGNFLFSGERTGGMPMRILSGGRNVLVIDDEGSIAWLDGATGRVEAVMRFYADEWELTSVSPTSSGDSRRVSGR
jgi:hypothetical protein